MISLIFIEKALSLYYPKESYMGNVTLKSTKKVDKVKSDSTTNVHIKVSFKKVSQIEHEKYRVPVYNYLIP